MDVAASPTRGSWVVGDSHAVRSVCLVAAARRAPNNAHAPYSGWRVGAAVTFAGGDLEIAIDGGGTLRLADLLPHPFGAGSNGPRRGR